jgi:hypothetical protein
MTPVAGTVASGELACIIPADAGPAIGSLDLFRSEALELRSIL